ncbi:pentatricopeptide repeat-containing protein At3g48250, chloroplastic-like [Euphorbia lathyris]|uniref:pentatricopeptide repeat-containing protein At3g48250, chloroplastic-like n=1 Tax=Euphorbia lathyris TaxID=212925 RepID=UPI00331389DC
MNRTGTIFSALRFSNSLLSSRIPVTRQLLTQVTHFSPLSQHSHTSYCFDTHQKLYFSSKPSTLVQLLLVNDWSTELETQLENSNPILTHETVIYVLRNLGKDPHQAWHFFNWVSKRDDFKPSSPLYSLLLRILANNYSWKYFGITLRKMKEQGFYIGEDTYFTILLILKKEYMHCDAIAFKHFFNRMLEVNAMDSVVKSVVTVILGTEWDNEVEKQLGDMGILLTDNFVIRVLKRLRDYPAKALQFFYWICKDEAYECNAVTYNEMVRFLARNDSVGEFWSVVEEMKNAGHEMDMDTYIKISRQFQKNKLIEDAVKLYEFMMDGPFKPSVQDCCWLLRSISACDAPDLSLVKRVVSKCEVTGSSLSKAVYDGIHRCLTSAGNFDEAEHIRKNMKNAGYEPDNITYNQQVFGLCKAKKLEEAYRFFNEMEAHGCVPDIKTWTVLIQGHCAAKQIDMALRCFAKMRKKNVKADAGLLDILINALLGEKRIDDAYTLLVEMVRKARLRPWSATYGLLTKKLLGARKIEQAFSLLRLMKQSNLTNEFLVEPFVECLSKFGTVEDAAYFLKVWSGKERPSTFAYLHLFRSFFEEGRHSEAKDLLYKCPRHIVEHPNISELFDSAKNGDAAS